VSANLDLVRSIYAAREQDGYFSSGWAHPEIEFVFADGPNLGSWKGVGPMVEAWRDFLSAWDEVHPQVEAYRDSMANECWRSSATGGEERPVD